MFLFKLKLKLKWFIGDVLTLLGIPFKASKRHGETQVICFHGICRDDQAFINGRFLKEAQMKGVLKQIKRHFNVLTLDQYMGKSLDNTRLNVLLTFDDGYRNNKEILVPILESMGLPATFFVTTEQNAYWMDLVDILHAENCGLEQLNSAYPATLEMSNSELKNWIIQQGEKDTRALTQLLRTIATPYLKEYSDFWELMDECELKEVINHPLITVANHSSYHLNYANLTQEEVILDFEKCKEYLSLLGSSHGTAFAYPFGSYYEECIEQLSEKSDFQFIADGNPNYSGKATDRLVVNPFISVRNQLNAIQHGKY